MTQKNDTDTLIDKKEMSISEYFRSIFIKLKKLSINCDKTKKAVNNIQENLNNNNIN